MGNVLIERLQNVFGPPERTENPEAFVAELHRITGGFSPGALDHAASTLIADGGKSWPAPKTVVQACVDAEEALAVRRGQPQAKSKYHQWLDDVVENGEKWAREFCKSTEIGQRAFAEGWGKSLYLWASSYAQQSYKRDTPPNPAQRPQSSDIEYWVRYCRAPASWIESERVTYLREPWSQETNARLNRRVADLRAGRRPSLPTFKAMPTELENDSAPTVRPEPEPQRPVAPDRSFWAKRFGRAAAGLASEADE